MTDEQRNSAQDVLDGLLRDAYSRGYMDATNDQKDIGELEERNKEMFAIIKSLVVNRHIIADSHFEGVRERLIDMAETILNKVNGETK